MGCRPDQERSADALRERLAPHTASLCTECQGRIGKNVFRVLDCRHRTCHALAWQGEGSPFLLCEACTAHFDEVRRQLTRARIPFDDPKVFARGLDYYTRTVFEVRASGLGAQDAVAAGGRYDHLVEELGGPAVGAVGFAAGLERVLMAADRAGQPGQSSASSTRRGLYLAVTHPRWIEEGFRFVQQLRERSVCAMMDYDGRSLKAQFREADKARCRLVAILAEAEAAQRVMALKDLEQGSQQTVAFDAFVEEVAKRLEAVCH
jgi:histidyl-tRNA synthetase